MGNCPIHNVPFKLVPAGTSKTTGKPYNAFWACPERGCREKPQVSTNMMPQSAPVKEDKPDWDKIAEGKVRHGVVCAMIEAGKTYEEIASSCEKYVQLIINEQPF